MPSTLTVFAGGGSGAASAGFDADQSHFFIGKEGVENASRIGAATDTSDHRVGQSATLVQALFPAFLTNYALEFSNNPRERVGANH